MDFLRRAWSGAPPATIGQVLTSDDIIYPLHTLDQAATLRSIIVTWTLRFDDILDPNQLSTSLAELLEIGDWRKLGGRLKVKVSSLHDIT